MSNKITVGISLPKEKLAQIDSQRGDVPRSRFLLRLLERYSDSCNYKQQIQEGKQKTITTDSKVGAPDQQVMEYTRITPEGNPAYE